MTAPPAPLRYRLFLILYRLGWRLGMPLAFAYLRRRARRDPAYALHWDERRGHGPVLEGAVWVHAVSLGEMRSALALVRGLLDRGERVVTTHLTPAGRRAAEAAFAPEIAAGRLVARYLPVETAAAWRRFLTACRPKVGLSLEVEVWPVMIEECARAGVPLWLANSQVPGASVAREGRLRRLLGQHPAARAAGVMAKSNLHAARFRALGAGRVEVTGELRFDQPVPPAQIASAAALKPRLARPVVVLASVVAGEEGVYLEALARLRDAGPAPLILWVPRAPERFDATADLLASAGLRVLRRSGWGAGLAPDPAALSAADVVLGDSLGEMFFYLGLGDIAVVGGGFLPSGAHNVIEPLALRLPVLTGPQVWTIEHPAVEAQAAGVLRLCADADALAQAIRATLADPAALAAARDRAAAFLAAHAGGSARTLAILTREGVVTRGDLP